MRRRLTTVKRRRILVINMKTNKVRTLTKNEIAQLAIAVTRYVSNLNTPHGPLSRFITAEVGSRESDPSEFMALTPYLTNFVIDWTPDVRPQISFEIHYDGRKEHFAKCVAIYELTDTGPAWNSNSAYADTQVFTHPYVLNQLQVYVSELLTSGSSRANEFMRGDYVYYTEIPASE